VLKATIHLELQDQITRRCSLSPKVTKCPPNLNSTVTLTDTTRKINSTMVNTRMSILWFLSNMNNANSDKLFEDTDEIVPQVLIDHFILMASKDINQNFNYHCAYSFPAVVLTLGKKNWYRLKVKNAG
jgi:hypothetical protein